MSDDKQTEDVPAPVEDDDNFFTENNEKPTPITPGTRRLIIASLAVIALVSIISEVVLIVVGKTTSDALLTIAATSTGALGGIALPTNR